jgi:hypothetical protein
MRARRLHIVLAAAAAVLAGAFSQAAAGYSRGGAFTAPGYGARAWGMAGAAVASGADEGATYWNPALLSLVQRGRIGFSYVNLVPGTESRHSYLAYSRAIVKGPLDAPGLAYAEHALGILYGNLMLELSDGRKYTENSIALAYSYSPEYFISFGASMSLLLSSSDVGEFDGKGTTVTAGIRVVMFDRLTLGLVGRNLFSRVLFDTGEDYQLDRSFTLGAAFGLAHGATLEGDIVAAYGGLARIVVGGEGLFFSNVLALRAGVSGVTTGENRTVPHMGLGIRLGRVHLDYNANLDTQEAFDDTHRLSLAVEL